MPFDAEIQTYIREYVGNYLPTDEWYTEYFDFIRDRTLAERLKQEFQAARYVYKVMEGLQAEDWLLLAQVRMQVIQYASIYEAIIHYLLFDVLRNESVVQLLLEKQRNVRIDIPEAQKQRLARELEHDGRPLRIYYERIVKRKITEVRFEHKAKGAVELGLISEDLADDLVLLYEVRNGVHIHAEIRKEIGYELGLSIIAYRRHRPLKVQIVQQLEKRGLYPVPHQGV